MVAAVFGFLGSIVGLIVTAMVTAAGITFLVLAWRAGILDDMAGWVTSLITGGLGLAGEYFGFLRDLLTFATG